MAGLDGSKEEKAAQVAALVREHAGYLQRAGQAGDDEDERKRWEALAEGVSEQLRLRGHEGEAPSKRAATRQQHKAETR